LNLSTTFQDFFADDRTALVVGGFLGASALILLGVFLWKRWQYCRFVYQFELLWDKAIQPYCPGCRKRLADWQQHASIKFRKDAEGKTVKVPTTYYAFHCSRCMKTYRLVDSDGYEVTLEEARKQVVFKPLCK